MMPSTKGMASLGASKYHTSAAAADTLANTGSEVMMSGLSGGVLMGMRGMGIGNGDCIAEQWENQLRRVETVRRPSERFQTASGVVAPQ